MTLAMKRNMNTDEEMRVNTKITGERKRTWTRQMDKEQNCKISTKNKQCREVKEGNMEKSNPKTTRLGTWNLRGVYQEGAIKNLVREIKRYKMDIVAVQETHLKDTGVQEIENVTFFRSGNNKRQYGVGFLVEQNMKERVRKFEARSDRLCSIRIRGETANFTIINIHAPTEEKEEDVKDVYYEELENYIDSVPKQDILIIIGDANAKVGNEEIYKEITGAESKHHDSNDNGQRLIALAIEKELKIMSTHFKRKDIHKGTWIIPGGSQTNQIDHVLIQAKNYRMITNVRTYRGADVDSDHMLVVAKVGFAVTQKLRRRKRQITRFNMKEFQNETVVNKYRQELDERLQKEQITTAGVEERWKKIEESVRKATENNVTPYRGQKRKQWLDEECDRAIELKKKYRLKMLQSGRDEDKETYCDQRRKVKKLCRKKKRQQLERNLTDIEINYQNKEVRRFYKDIKDIKKGYRDTVTCVKDKQGNLIANEEEKLKRWKQHFEELLNGNEEEMPTDTHEEQINEGDAIAKPTQKEIEEIINSMKNNKSPGANGITAENLKYGGDILLGEIYKLICQIWEEEDYPDSWKTSIIQPIHKKGDVTDCSNYRGIALVDVVYKVLATLIKQRLENHAVPCLGEYQGGFRKGRSTTDQVFMLKQTLIGCYEYEIPTYLLFVDFKGAYDNLSRQELFEILKDFQIPTKLIRLVKMTLQKTKSIVKVNGALTGNFEVRKGVRQGDPLSTLLFNLVLEKVIRAGNINREGSLYIRMHQCLAYADDVVLLARNRKELEQVTKNLIEAAESVGLKFNTLKTKFMELKNGKKRNVKENLRVNTQTGEVIEFEEVESYMYLGVLVNNKCEEDKEIELRLAKSRSCLGGLNRILKSKNISRNAKLRIYKTVLRPTLTYGCETWVLNKNNQTKLEIWERKVLRKIFGGKNTEFGWERRTNAELYELYNDNKITDYIRGRRLQWLGHLERMDDSREVKRIAWRIPIGKRKRGRPRRKWREAVEEDLEQKQIRDWRRLARDRKQWKNIIKLWA